VVFAGELAIGLAHVLEAGPRLDAEDLVQGAQSF